ncbi:MAG: AAA family ATPase [Chloroflexi bacterium]|nr:AAA family ATPase [Chloroflexota bacterium]
MEAAVLPSGPASEVGDAAAGLARGLETEERRLVTMLFADLVGFTALSERLDAEEVREITTECLRSLVAEAARYDGTVDKLIGDCVMVLFGAPLAHEDDAARALRAGLGMQRAMATFNQRLEREGGPRLALRIGIESGEVVAGTRRVGGVSEYTVIGDAVNIASRLQGAAEPGSVVVGETAARLAGAGFAFQALAPLSLKNKARPVAAAVLLGESAAPTGGGRTASLVGRDEELGLLENCLGELRRGRGQVAAVIGEPGLGKSRLLAELRARGGDLTWLRCPAFAHEGTLSLGLTRTLTRRLCDIEAEEPEGTAAGQLRERPRGMGRAADEPVLAHLLGLPLSTDAEAHLAALEPRELQRLTFDAVGGLIEQRASPAPLALQLEDLHWADPSSVDLLLELMELVERWPVFFCYAFRPEREAPAWALHERAAREFPHRYSEVRLRPLSEAASARLVAGLLGLEAPPAGLQSVLERASGTPLWVEELVRMLVERGLLVAESGGWRVTADLERVELPATLKALMVARIDRLGEARPTLQAAAVIGRRFPRRVLARIAGDDPSLDQHLLRAQRGDLVRELAAVPEQEYGFKHVLTQEAAYATLLVRRRRELHLRVAEVLEELYPERLDEIHGLLAQHYEQAESWERALEHARAAAEAARAHYANREALAHYDRAICAAERADVETPRRLALHEARAGLRELLGQFDPARADYEVALELADQAGDGGAQARLLGALGMLWGGHRDYQRGLELTGQAAAAAAAIGDVRAMATARERVGVMLFNLARLADARRELQTALELFGQLNDEPGRAQVLDILTMCALCAGDTEAAVACGREAIERLEALGDRATAATTMNMMGIALGYRGDRAAAEALIRRGAQTWVEIGARGGEAFSHMALAQAAEPFGAYDLALAEGEAGVAIAREIGHREWTAANLAFLGRTRRACGDVVGARRLHEEMLAIAGELGTALWYAEALGELGEDAAMLLDEATATRLLAESIAAGGDALLFTARSLLMEAELSLRGGRSAEALSRARACRERLAGFSVFTLDADRLAAEALAELGQAAEAEAILRQAAESAATLGARPARWRACLALGELLERQGRTAEAGQAFGDALAALEATATGLPAGELHEAFARSEPMRRARAGLGRD